MAPYTTRSPARPAHVIALYGNDADELELGSVDGESRCWLHPEQGVVGLALLSLGDPHVGMLRFRAVLTHADHLEPEIIAWAEAHAGARASLRVVDDGRGGARQAALARLGLEEVRRFATVERPLGRELPAPHVADGYTIRRVVPERDRPAWIDAYNESFIDHWDFEPLTPSTYASWLVDDDYDPRRDLVAIAPDDTISAFCYGSVAKDTHGRLAEGWIGLLGTRPAHRGRGLARAVLLAALAELRAEGLPFARSEVDCANASGAWPLYESLGFRVIHVRSIYEKLLHG